MATKFVVLLVGIGSLLDRFADCQFEDSAKQPSCEVTLPNGWKEGEDSSGVRTSAQGVRPAGTRTNITYSCPGRKVGEDGKGDWTAHCTKSGDGWEFSYGFGRTWPECGCVTYTNCKMEGAKEPATYKTRYAGQISNGESPGLDLRIPMPPSAAATWLVKIMWDMETRNHEVAIQSKTRGVIMEMLDPRGIEHSFRALNDSYLPGEELHLDVGFVFLSKKVNEDKKKWHYPCIKEIVCKLEEEDNQTGFKALVLVMVGVGCILLLVTCCCVTTTWCLKQDRSYGLRPLTGTSIQVKPSPYDMNLNEMNTDPIKF